MNKRIKDATTSVQRAYSVVDFKSMDEDGDKVWLEGIATTPTPDRMGDVVEPDGAKFKLPIALLWQHNSSQPIGMVESAEVTKDGINVRAWIKKGVTAQIDDVVKLLKAGLVRGLSIGFRGIDVEEIKGSWSLRFKEWEWLELSAVTIPANAEATIQTVKSIDTEQRAASGALDAGPPPGDSGTKEQPAKRGVFFVPNKGKAMNIQELIKAFEAKRGAIDARMNDLMAQAAADGERTLDAEEEDEYDGLASELKAVDAHLVRLRAREKAMADSAAPVAGKDGREASESRSPAIVRTVRNDEPGVAFARFALAMYAGKGNTHAAKEFAEHKFGGDGRLQNVMKAAVAAGTTTSPTWAGNLVDYQNMTSEFIEFLRPRTIVGQFGTTTVGGVTIPGLRRIPFNVRIPGKTAAGRAQWVGEGYRKPATSSTYAPVTMKWAKIAAFSVITDELDRFSEPSVQTLVRDDLAEAVIERMDEDFIDPAKDVGTGATESPASITHGLTPIPSTGSDGESVRADLAALWAVADATNMPAGSAVYITDSRTARSLSMMQNPLGQPEFGAVTPMGGSINGVPLIVSNYVPSDSNGSLFILAFASEIYLADDGVVNIDVSREATVFLDDNAASATPTAAQLVSLWQTNQLGIRAERYVRWQKRRPQAVAYLNGVDWGIAAT